MILEARRKQEELLAEREACSKRISVILPKVKTLRAQVAAATGSEKDILAVELEEGEKIFNKDLARYKETGKEYAALQSTAIKLTPEELQELNDACLELTGKPWLL